MRNKPCLNSLVMFFTVALFSAGCRSIGPATVPRDRFDYSTAITESWKRQTLLNIVKLRYLDPPIFVDVGQIVAGYSIEIGATVGGSLPETDGFGGNTLSLGGSGKYTDRPTVTYTPLTGNKFVKGLMTPISPDVLFYTIQAGWPADGMMLAGVAAINGLKNEEVSAGSVSLPDPDFVKAMKLLRKIQKSGAVGMRVIEDAGKHETSLITFRSQSVTPETLEDISELRKLLHLDPEAAEFRLVFGSAQSNPKEIAVVTRSMIHIMMAMASQVDAPQEHVAEGRTTAGWESQDPAMEAIRMLHIYSSKKRPADSFASVNYRNHWFWLDDRDLKSKRALAFTMMLFTLADTGERDKLPLITIPAQ